VSELLGLHRYQIDAKGRVALPTRFREAFAGGVYITLGQDGGLYAFPPDEWSTRVEEARARPLAGRESRDFARMFFANALQAELDGQGRLVIPQRLRAQIGLEREAVVVGVSDHLEIWAAPAWDRYEQAHLGAYVAGALDPGPASSRGGGS